MRSRLVRSIWLPLAAVTIFATCDIPTAAPVWTTEWILPIEKAGIGVDALLPNDVALAPDSLAFVVTLRGTRSVARLGESCARCEGAAGQMVPKPAFVITVATKTLLPDDLVSATLRGSTVPVSVMNGFNFDPLRPGAEVGSIRVATASQGAPLGQVLVSGASESLSPGERLRVAMPLAGVVRDAIELELTLDSPLGDPVVIDPALQLELVVGETELSITEAQVRLRDLEISSAPITTSVDGIPTDLVERLEGGGIEIDISNPFEIRGVFQIRISYDDGVMTRYTDLVAGESTIEFDLSQIEIRELLSSTSIMVEFVGEVNSATGMVTIRPGQRIELVPRLFATLRVES